jgi:hypothetical protein
MGIKAVDPGAYPHARQAHLLGDRRYRRALGARPDELRALHHPMGGGARMGQALEFIGLVSCQRSYAECHAYPSNASMEGVYITLEKDH